MKKTGTELEVTEQNGCTDRTKNNHGKSKHLWTAKRGPVRNLFLVKQEPLEVTIHIPCSMLICHNTLLCVLCVQAFQ